jgi:predicted Rossmann-fold nucleotide-binding protein
MHQMRIKPAHDFNADLSAFLNTYGLGRVIGVSGGSDDKLAGIPDDDPLQTRHAGYQDALHERLLQDIMKPLRGYGVAILTGGTKWGVPKMAVQVARQHGFKTIGVLPKAGEHHSLEDDMLDLKIVVEPLIGEGAWGDEGPVWTSLIDGLIVIGGAAGTLTELAHIMKLNEARCKRGDRPKYMVPIHGTGGVADQVHQLWAKPAIRDRSMPRDRVYSGAQAARLLIEALDLDECFAGANN